MACYARLDQIASDLQMKYELHPMKAARRDIEATVWSLVYDHPALKALLSHAARCLRSRPPSRSSKVGRIGQCNGLPRIGRQKPPLNGLSDPCKLKLSWNRRI